MASKLVKRLVGENHETSPLMMAWHALIGQLQQISSRMSAEQHDKLRAWWDQSDMMMRRLAQGVFEASINGHHQSGAEPAFNSNVPSGDSHINAQTAQKDASELPHDDEETRELKIADTILKAAHGMAKTPDVEEIIRQAEELKRIHGVQ